MTARRALIVRTVIATLLACALAGAGVGVLVLKSGWYNIGATRQHWQPVYSVLEQGMHESVRHHAREVRVPQALPASEAKARLLAGAALYRQHCVQCHGAPGVAQAAIGQSMQPIPGPLVDAAKRWQPNELYWITRHGIKMSGMPAWGHHLSEAQLWSLVAFLGHLPQLGAQDYAQLQAQAPQIAQLPQTTAGRAPFDGNSIARGKVALTQFACQACHLIPGITGSQVLVGPPLDQLAKRRYLAGRLPNTPEHLQQWIRDPQSVKVHTAMPNLGVDADDARDMAAYLLSLD
ncbi:c-type cytochrome [Janthinobacterium aquaticum]|uniref:c-type cytochrome n=1 Tax=Janthinobacterium sp. FT58W TaxID=2654254 RepID=UPI0012658801|nr:cytochrome c [Janthinobacterium sp. FT58W]KAB8041741.1 c-type cytochrome [Janthinobacterium sp. FT58W]